ncbi:phosphoadenosine phosphosulfate reductase family protein [Heliobacterium chlorum]|uniref:Phosphoadenosine phosphosulfate reductase family protein n=1 Tax=Heliobacterium chlorum TaxID=2698 RepID=A0ABR7T410_HELCL|nr:phosphoadenosine phosphosulfate reductase family protein [Heliobacterium chlorum]MBC9785508.1 phosphoadenosine phosphosulfate reductase family protein [Heliobacterium chlorum]
MQDWQLKQLQSLPLEAKIQRSIRKIREWYEAWDGEVYVNYSGGKDSTVLLHLVRSVYPHVQAMFADTGLEFPEVREQVKQTENVCWLRPKKSFYQVIQEYGYPAITKAQAGAIYKLRKQNLSEKYRNKLLYGDEKGTFGMVSKKWHYLLNAPFLISDKCCNAMKKEPFYRYQKMTGKKPIIGTMAIESARRKVHYLNHGCNVFDSKEPSSKPISFWTEQDILEYLRMFNIPYASVYGEIVEDENGRLTTTGEKRTGCVFCMFGVHLEKGENRFLRLKRTHPKMHGYCMDKLGIAEVLDYIGVDSGKEVA